MKYSWHSVSDISRYVTFQTLTEQQITRKPSISPDNRQRDQASCLTKTQPIYSQQWRNLDSECDLLRLLPPVAPILSSVSIHSLLSHGPGTDECHVHSKTLSVTFPQTGGNVLPFHDSGQTLCLMITTSVYHWSNSMENTCSIVMTWQPRCNDGCKYPVLTSSTRDSDISYINGTNVRVTQMTVYRNRLVFACSSVLFWTSVTHPEMTKNNWQYCQLSSLTLSIATVGKVFSLLGLVWNDQAALYLFQKHLLYRVQWNLYPSFPHVSFFRSYIHCFWSLKIAITNNVPLNGMHCSSKFHFSTSFFQNSHNIAWTIIFRINGESNVMFSEHIVAPNI